MSEKYINAVREASAFGYTPSVRAVLMALASYADDKNGRCWPGYATLASSTSLSRVSIYRAVKTLTQSDLVKIVGKHGQEYTATHVYELNLEAIRSLNPYRNLESNLVLFPGH